MLYALKAELRRALSGKWFFIALAAVCAISVASAVGALSVAFENEYRGLEYREQKYFRLSVLSCFRQWIVIDAGQPATGLFFFLLPLLVVLPYAWSLSFDVKTGYVNNLITRTSRANYCVSKFLSVFLSAGIVAVVPVLLNLLICACALPAYVPDVFDVVYFGVYENSLWSEAFYSAPLLYAALFSGLIFVFSGLWAVSVSALSLFVKNRLVFTVAPFLFLLLVEYLNLMVFPGAISAALTPFEYLRGAGSPFITNGWVVLLELAFLLAFSTVVFFRFSKRDAL